MNISEKDYLGKILPAQAAKFGQTKLPPNWGKVDGVIPKIEFPPARGVRHVNGKMNKTEAAYSLVLESRKRSGEIVQWWFERWTFKLADDVRYTPDFIVMNADGTLSGFEVKGSFMRDDARVKLRVFAEQFPIPISLVKRKGTEWTVDPI